MESGSSNQAALRWNRSQVISRPYLSSVRDERSRATRQRILTAAGRLLLGGSYASVTIAAIAAEAGVSPQTVYNSVGGKAQVVKAVYDVTLAGDDEPLPIGDRPAFRAVLESVPARGSVTARTPVRPG